MEGYRRGSEDVIEGQVVAKGSSRQANFVAPAPVALRPATPPARVVVEPFDLSTAFESRPVTVDPDGAKGRAILFAVRGMIFLIVFFVMMVASTFLAAFAGLMNWDLTLPLWAFGLSAAATLVERTTRFTVILGLPYGKDAEHLADALIDHAQALPEMMRKTLTWDQGSEMAKHAALTLATDMPVYFAHPRSPWERGTNENTNGPVSYTHLTLPTSDLV